MGRKKRPYLPGAVYHATARTLGRQRLFTPSVRTGALADLARVAPASRCRILAVAIMSNHLHLVFQQGDRPMAKLMQPLLRRIAHRAHRALDHEGPVFWRHYSVTACLNPTHARNAIVYTHLNPVRAGICRDPSRYAWTSHLLYSGERGDQLHSALDSLGEILDPTIALPLFATDGRAAVEQLRAGYRAAVEWRMRADDAGLDRDPAVADPPLLAAALPQPRWGEHLSPLFHAPVQSSHAADRSPGAVTAPDMTAIAENVLRREAPHVPLSLIRASGRVRTQTRLRHAIICRLHSAGYRNRQIAGFMNISESTVSAVVRRWGPEGTSG